MKFSQPFLLVSISLGATLALLSAPTASALPANPIPAMVPPHPLPAKVLASKIAPQPQQKPRPRRKSSPRPQQQPSAPQQRRKQLLPHQPRALSNTPSLAPINPDEDLSSPMLLLPDSSSVWHTGTTQTVKWSKKYASRLPEDTTVDIVLVDALTNKSVHSLKRFVPFKKGSAQVLVPAKVQEGISFVLVLELYHGRSKKPVAAAMSSEGSSSPSSSAETVNTDASVSTTNAQDGPRPSLSRVVRRSDISIAQGTRKRPRDMSSSGHDDRNSDHVHHDLNDDDYYAGQKEARPFEFYPEEMRQEYPNVHPPIELQHTFGLHQKVYTMTPYTLEWKVPIRVAELLEYTRQINARRTRANQAPPAVFLAKVLVQLVTDSTLEPVSTLARDVPAETMFQYLQIHDRVPQAFYRLRVQMVVVEVAGTRTDLQEGDSAKVLTSLDFPDGGRVIDRYESITRKFWVSIGAL